MISSDDQESESDQGSEDEEDASDDPSRDRRETFSKIKPLKVSLVQLYRGFESRERYLSSLSLTPRHKVVRNL